MKVAAAIRKNANSKGAAIFRKMLDDKNTVRPHLKTGGKISDLKDKFNLVKIASIKKVWWFAYKELNEKAAEK